MIGPQASRTSQNVQRDEPQGEEYVCEACNRLDQVEKIQAKVRDDTCERVLPLNSSDADFVIVSQQDEATPIWEYLDLPSAKTAQKSNKPSHSRRQDRLILKLISDSTNGLNDDR